LSPWICSILNFCNIGVNGSYANYINRKRNRSGHLLQGKYKGILVDRDTYFLELSRYLHLNPVRAKIVESPEEYRQSSYRTYVTGKKDAMVTTDLLLGMVAGDGKIARKAYRKFVEAGMGEGVRNSFADVYGGVILGSLGFIKQALGSLAQWMKAKIDTPLGPAANSLSVQFASIRG
jgi:REP-associated tyrosine transposase